MHLVCGADCARVAAFGTLEDCRVHPAGCWLGKIVQCGKVEPEELLGGPPLSAWMMLSGSGCQAGA